MKKLIVVLLAVMMLLTAVACTGKGPEAPVVTNEGSAPGSSTQSAPVEQKAERKLKDSLVVALKSEPSNLDPHGTSEMVAFSVQLQIFDTLVQRDSEGNIIPWLAESWERVDDCTIRFHLREGVKFHNGDPLTAEDVAYTIRRGVEMPASKSIMVYFDPDNTKVVDDLTVDVATKSPFSGVFNYLANSRACIVSKKAIETMGADAYGRNPIGTGAFKFVSWSTGEKVVLARNDDFWGDKPQFSELTFRFIPETANRAIELETGAVDVVFDPGSSDCDRMKDDSRFTLHMRAGYGQMAILMNLSDPVIDNLNFRKALFHALDVETITGVVYGDYAQPATGMYSALGDYVDFGLYEYNPELAKKYLKDAGYEGGVTLNMTINQSQESGDVAELAQNMWAAIGINATINTFAQQEWLAGTRRGDYQVAPSSGTITTGDRGHSFKNFNIGSDQMLHPKDETLNKMIQDAASAIDDATRSQMNKDIQQYIHDNYLSLWVSQKMMCYLTSANVENFDCNPGGTPYLGNVVVYEG